MMSRGFATIALLALVAAAGATTLRQKHYKQLNLSPSPAPAPAPAAAPIDLNDKMPLKAAEQGFMGEMVQHKNKTTMSSDWGREFGPNMYGGYPPKPKKRADSGAAAATVSVAAMVSVAVLAVSRD
eukprot:gnl/TRDRNA2_/TRDRNA2_84583_c0_seq2.p2 gnl/TRDRNA2_/TRDRNA2_84583_c0~~gnl/TRDRNA2_/TRDRNA2_84583_c0_seq2.p2  ORF type:complete len:126 (-),score=34.99 gnl/TRDRNA2_/TRDRNA2_84583_c0_seq2:55-432(-)